MSQPTSVFRIGRGYLTVPRSERGGRFGLVALLGDDGQYLELSGVPVATHAVLVAVRRERIVCLRWRRWFAPGEIRLAVDREVPVRLGSGRVRVTGLTAPRTPQAIGVEPDRPGYRGPWLDPQALSQVSGAFVELQLLRPVELRELPPPDSAGAR
ncbi:hypothetical protein [Glycomyces sp. MUSA5-2]|uniref:hypothetical protein n=1 Tax=Glycomyces sp. MUSA5-2 TaxID=2053002 RepID=UPI003007F77F